MKPPWRKRRPEPARPSGAPLGVDAEATAYGALVTIAGELDIATVPQVSAALREEPVASAAAVVVDLVDVTFMDSTGLAALIGLQREVATRGGRLAIACPEGPARLLFDVTGVSGELALHPSREEAEAAVR